MAEPATLKEQVRSFLREHPEIWAEEFLHILKDHPDVLEKFILSILPKIIIEHVDLIVKKLPEVIEKHPEIKGELYVVLSKEYVTKEEIKAILDEMREQREELRQLREDFNRHFEAMDRRFEAMDRRFEQQTKELRQLREDTNRRFEAVDRRFEVLIQEMKTMRKELSEEIRGVEKRLEIRISVLGGRWGEFAEETLRNTLRKLLSERLKVTKIQKWETQDEEGYVFNIPQKIEVDFLLKDDIDYLIEISASANERDVAAFFRKGELYKKKTNKTPRLLFIAVNMHEKGKILCEKLGIELITYDELIEEER